jgi:hypothetical protein
MKFLFSGVVTILIISIAICGCTVNIGNPTNPPITTPVQAPIPTPIPTPASWIKLDSIGTYYTGDTFKITGTTNLLDDSQIFMKISSNGNVVVSGYIFIKNGIESGSTSQGIVMSGVTPIDFPLDTSFRDVRDLRAFDPGLYTVEAISGSVTANETFTILVGPPTTMPPNTIPTTPQETHVCQIPTGTVGVYSYYACHEDVVTCGSWCRSKGGTLWNP